MLDYIINKEKHNLLVPPSGETLTEKVEQFVELDSLMVTLFFLSNYILQQLNWLNMKNIPLYSRGLLFLFLLVECRLNYECFLISLM